MVAVAEGCMRAVGLVLRALVVALTLSGVVAVGVPSQHRRRQTRALTVRLGGSMSLTGKFSALSRACLQGALLVAERVNETGLFRDPFGHPLALHLNVEDDEGERHRVQEIYERMAEKQEVDFFLGPYSSSLSIAVASISNASGILAMLPGAALPDLYQLGYRYAFTTSVMAADYMKHALQTIRSLGVRSLALLWDGESPFDTAMCAGAVEHARNLGLQVLASISLDDESGLTSQVRKLKAKSPDALVGCHHTRGAAQIVNAARALRFAPSTMVLSMAASEAFIKEVGAPSATYLMSPASWVPSLNFSCALFGSAAGFAQSYMERWGEAPLHQSAEVAASAIALLKALEVAGTLEIEHVRAALLGMDMETFYARLAFTENGTIRGASAVTEQVQPLSYTASRVVAVGAPNPQPLWPMLPWEQKEIQVYPCRPGEVLLALEPEVAGNGPHATLPAVCERCPTGKYRHPQSVVCENCEAGQYGATAGLSQCEACPDGALCPEGYRPGHPNATAGYYKLPLGKDLQIVPCDPKELCLGLGTNACLGQNTGILCAQCMPGFAFARFGPSRKRCSPCQSTTWNALTILLTVVAYSLYIWLIVKATLSASRSIRSIFSVILKICVNYIQFAGTAFEATEFKSMVVSICGANADYLTPFISIPEMLQYPIASMYSLDCLLAHTGIRAYQACILAGLMLMPAALLLQVVCTAAQKGLLGMRRPHSAFRPCCRRRFRRSADAERPGEGENDHRGRSGSSVTLPEAAIASRHRADPEQTCRGLSPVTPCTPKSPWRERLRTPLVYMSPIVTRFVNSTIIMSFVLHPVVVRLLVVGFECVDLDVMRQKHDLDVACRSEEHYRWLAGSTIGILVFGFGTPMVHFCMLWRFRTQLLCDDVRKRFGFLYNGFELRYYYFESVYMFRKVLILLFFTFPDMSVRMVLLVLISWAFILLHIRYQPFDNRSYLCLDRLEAMNLRALTVTVTARLVFDVRQHASGDFFRAIARHWICDSLLVLLPLLFHAWFIGFAAWCLFRNTVLKHLAFKADLWPERLTRWQQLLLCLEQRRNLAMLHEEPGTGRLSIDTSKLSSQEHRYLFVALCDTLHRYMGRDVRRLEPGCQRVHPGDVSTAVCEAAKRCQRSRRRRAERFEQLLSQQRHKGEMGFRGNLTRWFGELRLSLHAPSSTAAVAESEASASFGSVGVGRCRRLFEGLSRYSCRSRRPKPGDPERLAAPPRGLREAVRERLEKSKEFTVEDFYEALMPIWQEITEGRAQFDHVSGGVPISGRQMSLSELLDENGRCSGAVRFNSDCSLACSEGDGGGPRRRLGLEPGGAEKRTIVKADSGRIEGLLGTSGQEVQQSEWLVRADSGGLECLLGQAARTCQVELPTLLRQRDELVADNLELRAENEALKRRVAGPCSPQPPPQLTPQPVRCCSPPPSPRSPEEHTPVAQTHSARQLPSSPLGREPSTASAPAAPEPTAPTVVSETSPPKLEPMPALQTRSAWRVAMRQAMSASSPRGMKALSEVGPALAIHPATAVGLLTAVSVTGTPSAVRHPEAACESSSGRVSPMTSAKGRSSVASGDLAEDTEAPWSASLRPVDLATWPKVHEFKFLGAVRPTDDSAWPQIHGLNSSFGSSESSSLR